MNSLLPQIFVYFIIIQALFLSLHFFTINKPNLYSNKILGYLLLSFAFSILSFRLVLDIPEMNPLITNSLYIIHLILSFMMYILLYFYIKSLYDGKLQFSFRNIYIHLILFITYFVFIQFTIKKIPFILDEYSVSLTMINSVKVSLYFLYLVLVFILLKKEHTSFSTFFSAAKNPNLLWLLVLTGSFLFLWIIESFILLVIALDITEAAFDFILASTIIAPFIFINAILIMALKKPVVFYVNQNSYSWSLKHDDEKRYLNGFISLMEKENAYKDPDISLNKVSQLLDINPKYLSLILHKFLANSFPTIINKYRIESAIQIMQNSDDKTIQQIMYEVGYNSKSSFNHHFKKTTGFTPSDYKLKHFCS